MRHLTICTNHYIANGVMIEAKKLGLNIPQNLGIVGFDDTDMSALTTIRVPSRRMEEIAKYIISHLEEGTAECPPALEAELTIRSSKCPSEQAGCRLIQALILRSSSGL